MEIDSPLKHSELGVENNIDFPTLQDTNETPPCVVVADDKDMESTQSLTQTDKLPDDELLDEIPEIKVFEDTPSETAAFYQQIEYLQSQLDQLQGMLDQRDSVVTLQTREMAILEQEKNAARKEMEQSRREKETAVVKYAMAEKSLIDLRHGNEQLTKKVKDCAKETESLSARVKFVTNERDRANKDLRKSATECEAQKQEIFNLETKLKWSHLKIKQEGATRLALESKVSELSSDISNLRESQVQNQNQIRSGEKEIEAQLILLKHTVESKEKENTVLHASLAQLTSEFEELSRKHTTAIDDLALIRTTNTTQSATIRDFEKTHEELSNLLANYSQELASSQSNVMELQTHLDNSLSELNEMKDLRANYEEQSLDLQRIQVKGAELMLFTKELTEKSVDVENRLLLATAKADALHLENIKIRELFEEHRKVVVRLELDLKLCLEERAIDHQQMQSMVKTATCERNQMEERVDNCLGELDTSKRKHSQVVKELTRDIAVLKSKLDPKPLVERIDEQGPSKKTLIDRIAKLQRILARQTEKIEFLENHSAGLINQLKGKTH